MWNYRYVTMVESHNDYVAGISNNGKGRTEDKSYKINGTSTINFIEISL